MISTLSLFALATLSPAPEPAPFGGTMPNIVLIFADDFGVDMVGAYGEAPNPPCTPTLDQLAADGLLFRNAYATPVCASTRAQAMTGRYGFRTGVGTVGGGGGLVLGEETIAEMLVGYSTGAYGKWGLASGMGPAAANNPNDQGFDDYAGGTGSGIPNYFSWNKTINGSTSNTTTYATTDTADEAITAAQTLTQPFFLYVNFNAPHTPAHVPPVSLCPTGPCATNFCSSGPTTNTEQLKAMVEAMDTELDRFLDALALVDPNAYVIFMGDNGSANMATEPPFVTGRAKGSIYEGGINVPLLVKGPGVVQGETAALVATVDLAATITELAGQPVTTEDSVSMVPVFSNPAMAVRTTVYQERFSPNNGSGPFTVYDQAIRNERYKLIRRLDGTEELYDVIDDQFESMDLFPGMVDGSDEHVAYLALVQELECIDQAGGEDFTSVCNGDGGDQMGCTDCPCMNNAPQGTIGGCLNSAGTSARLTATGDPSVSLPADSFTDLRFGLCTAPPTAFAVLTSGDSVAPQNMTNPCFGMNSGIQSNLFDGMRCSIGNTRRHGGRSADSNGDVGVSNNPWGGTGAPSAGIAQAGGTFSSGQTRYFQVIHREDMLLSCMRGLNTSQAIEVTFTP